MKIGFKVFGTLLIAATMLFGACSQDSCPGAKSAGKGKPSGKGGEPDQKLFNEDMR